MTPRSCCSANGQRILVLGIGRVSSVHTFLALRIHDEAYIFSDQAKDAEACWICIATSTSERNHNLIKSNVPLSKSVFSRNLESGLMITSVSLAIAGVQLLLESNACSRSRVCGMKYSITRKAVGVCEGPSRSISVGSRCSSAATLQRR